jgi:hypothetical protein
MKRSNFKILESFETVGGFGLLISAGIVIQWWSLSGLFMFGIGFLLLFHVMIEQEVSDRRR